MIENPFKYYEKWEILHIKGFCKIEDFDKDVANWEEKKNSNGGKQWGISTTFYVKKLYFH